MADRKTPSQPTPRPAGAKATASKGSPPKAGGPKGGGSARPATKASGGRPGQPGKRPKSIVNQKTRPWGLITTVGVVVVFAAAIIIYAVTRSSSSSNSANAAYTVPEIADAKAIPGVVYKAEPNHTHISSGTVKYDTSPPTGGNHSPYWADCTGTVYPNAIANENAVHMLEHGAVWITYKPDLPASQVATLAAMVKGKQRLAMSPYPGDMKDNISLQSWGYQLFVPNASDKRIQEFINILNYNQKTTPESSATCSQPTFITHPSTWGHPLFAPAT
jgi:Protein of unknown function (DUF3105)